MATHGESSNIAPAEKLAKLLTSFFEAADTYYHTTSRLNPTLLHSTPESDVRFRALNGYAILASGPSTEAELDAVDEPGDMSKEFVALYNAAEDLAVSQLEGEEGPVRGMEHMQKMRKLVLDAWDDLGVVDGSRTEEQDAEMILLFERTFWGWRKEAGGDEEPSARNSMSPAPPALIATLFEAAKRYHSVTSQARPAFLASTPEADARFQTLMPFAKAWYRAGPTADVDSIPIPDDITDEFLALYRVGRVVVRPKKEAKDVVIKEHVEKIERLVMDWWELGLEGDEVGGGEEKERRDVEMKVLFERLFSALTEHQESDSDVVVADEKETGTAGRPSGSVPATISKYTHPPIIDTLFKAVSTYHSTTSLSDPTLFLDAPESAARLRNLVAYAAAASSAASAADLEGVPRPGELSKEFLELYSAAWKVAKQGIQRRMQVKSIEKAAMDWWDSAREVDGLVGREERQEEMRDLLRRLFDGLGRQFDGREEEKEVADEKEFGSDDQPSVNAEASTSGKYPELVTALIEAASTYREHASQYNPSILLPEPASAARLQAVLSYLSAISHYTYLGILSPIELEDTGRATDCSQEIINLYTAGWSLVGFGKLGMKAAGSQNVPKEAIRGWEREVLAWWNRSQKERVEASRSKKQDGEMMMLFDIIFRALEKETTVEEVLMVDISEDDQSSSSAESSTSTGAPPLINALIKAAYKCQKATSRNNPGILVSTPESAARFQAVISDHYASDLDPPDLDRPEDAATLVDDNEEMISFSNAALNLIGSGQPPVVLKEDGYYDINGWEKEVLKWWDPSGKENEQVHRQMRLLFERIFRASERVLADAEEDEVVDEPVIEPIVDPESTTDESGDDPSDKEGEVGDEVTIAERGIDKLRDVAWSWITSPKLRRHLVTFVFSLLCCISFLWLMDIHLGEPSGVSAYYDPANHIAPPSPQYGSKNEIAYTPSPEPYVESKPKLGSKTKLTPRTKPTPKPKPKAEEQSPLTRSMQTYTHLLNTTKILHNTSTTELESAISNILSSTDTLTTELKHFAFKSFWSNRQFLSPLYGYLGVEEGKDVKSKIAVLTERFVGNVSRSVAPLERSRKALGSAVEYLDRGYEGLAKALSTSPVANIANCLPCADAFKEKDIKEMMEGFLGDNEERKKMVEDYLFPLYDGVHEFAAKAVEQVEKGSRQHNWWSVLREVRVAAGKFTSKRGVLEGVKQKLEDAVKEKLEKYTKGPDGGESGDESEIRTGNNRGIVHDR